MSTVTLVEVKQYLRVIHDDDDTLIQDLIDAAERQALSYLAHDSFEVDLSDVDVPTVPPDVLMAIRLMVRADYEAADPTIAEQWRDVAHGKLYPYRQGFGV